MRPDDGTDTTDTDDTGDFVIHDPRPIPPHLYEAWRGGARVKTGAPVEASDAEPGAESGEQVEAAAGAEAAARAA